METKPLLYGLIGFFIGGLLVSVAAVTFEKDRLIKENTDNPDTAMSAASLKNKSGDQFDEAFISEMIAHHQGAIDMAKLARQQAKHDEIKNISGDIIVAQEKEIEQMKRWQKEWGYTTGNVEGHASH